MRTQKKNKRDGQTGKFMTHAAFLNWRVIRRSFLVALLGLQLTGCESKWQAETTSENAPDSNSHPGSEMRSLMTPAGGTSLALLALNTWQGDFDGDRRFDPTVAIFDEIPADANSAAASLSYYQVRSTGPTTEYLGYNAGYVGDIPTPGDFNGDGKAEFVVWRSSTGEFIESVQTTPRVWRSLGFLGGSVQIGDDLVRDVPVLGDYDGDGKTDLAVWRPSTATWYFKSSRTGLTGTNVFGTPTDVPVPGDYDGDGKTDIGIFRPASGEWKLQLATGLRMDLSYGTRGDLPVSGDFDGDGKTDLAVYRPQNHLFYVRRSQTGTDLTPVQLGGEGDVPVPGDYNGDGVTDFAVYRPPVSRRFPVEWTSLRVHYRVSEWEADISVPGGVSGIPTPVIAGRMFLSSAVAHLASMNSNPDEILFYGRHAALLPTLEGVLRSAKGPSYSVTIRDPLTLEAVMNQWSEAAVSLEFVPPVDAACIVRGKKAPVLFYGSPADSTNKKAVAKYANKPRTFRGKQMHLKVSTGGVGNLNQAANVVATAINTLNNDVVARGGQAMFGVPSVTVGATSFGPSENNIDVSCEPLGGNYGVFVVSKFTPLNFGGPDRAQIKIDCGFLQTTCNSQYPGAFERGNCLANSMASVLAHEVGHPMGLADDYENEDSVMTGNLMLGADFTAEDTLNEIKNRFAYVSPVLNELYNNSINNVWQGALCYDWKQAGTTIGGTSGSGGGMIPIGPIGGTMNPYLPGYNINYTCAAQLCQSGWQMNLATCSCTQSVIVYEPETNGGGSGSQGNPWSGTGSGSTGGSGGSGSTGGGSGSTGGGTGSTGTSGSTTQGLRFVPVTPCRVVDTRNSTGLFGGPSLIGGYSRNFPIPQGSCGVPSSAKAYSLNLTVVPKGRLDYITAYPAGSAQPYVSTLNSLDGRVKSNALILPAGSISGGVSLYATNNTDALLDVNGYFVDPSQPAGLVFYPINPCRIVDTRNANGSLGGPFLPAGQTRSFPVLSSSCGIPATAQAYSLNYTVVPRGALGFLTTWATGQAQPGVSVLNAPTGVVTASASLVKAGASGQISTYASNDTDLIIDANGYFAPPGGASGGMSLYTLPAPCRILDTRNAPYSGAPFSGAMTVVPNSPACQIPVNAGAAILNATVVPQGSFGHLSLWPTGSAQPLVSTLNAPDGAVTSNFAIVPPRSGSISAYAYSLTHLVLDTVGYFAP